MLVNPDRAEKALIYMAETDMEYASLKAEVDRWNYVCKRTRANIFLAQESGSIEQKKANAEISKEVNNCEAQRTEYLTGYEAIAAKRKTEQLILESTHSPQSHKCPPL